MPHYENELGTLGAELHKTHGVHPDNVDAHDIVVTEVQKLADHPVLEDSKGRVEYLRPLSHSNLVELSVGEPTPSKHLALNRSALTIKGELMLMKRVEILREHGTDVEGDLLAEVQVNEANSRQSLVEAADGRFFSVSVDHDARATYVSELEDVYGDGHLISRINGTVNFDYDTRSKQWRVSAPTLSEGAVLTVAEAVNVTDDNARFVESQEKLKRKQHKNWLIRAAGSTAIAASLYAGLTPGGVADMIIDQRADNGDVVSSSLDYIRTGGGDNLIELQQAGDRVEQTMNDLDEHNYQAILDRGAEFKESHIDQFMPEADTASIIESIESAESKEAVKAALARIIEFYGYELTINDAVELDELKYTAAQIASALSVLPKSLTDQANLSVISISTHELVSDRLGRDASGVYTHSSDGSRFAIDPKITIAAREESDPANRLQPLNEVFLHEIGHALDYNEATWLVAPIQEQSVEWNDFEDFMKSVMWDSPQAVSNYAQKKPTENKAENFAALFSESRYGLTHPDDARRFESVMNKGLIANLALLERSYPGIADYIVSLNSRLMQGQTLETQ